MTRKKSSLRIFQHRLEYGLVRFTAALVALLPRWIVWHMGGISGLLGWAVLPSRRRLAQTNLRLALGDSHTEKHIRQLARASFVNFARSTFDMFWSISLNQRSISQLVDYDSTVERNEAQVANEGQGCIVALAHFGNWELLGLAGGYFGKVDYSMVGKALHNPFIDNWLRQQRERSGNRQIYSRKAAREILSHLKEQRSIAILMDQRTPARYGGLKVDFFGRPAMTSKAVASFALMQNVPVCISTCLPDGRGHYRVCMSELVYPTPSDDHQQDLLQWTAQFNRMLEAEIRKAPEHYFWMHNRWGVE
jgi:Kdo2-lipid IVA lauroyltransferase/acyltransferase